MSKLLPLFVLCLSFSMMANAQFNKGEILLGGQLGYSTTKNNYMPTQKINSGNFTFSIGKAIKNNAVFGINLSYLPGTQSTYDSNFNYLDYKETGYSIGIFYRVYKTLGKEFSLFGEGGLTYTGATSSSKDISGNENFSGKTNGGNVYIMPGLAYRVSKCFFLEITIPNLFSAGYSSHRGTSSGTTTTQNQFNIGANLSSNTLSNLGIGFRLVL